MGAPSSFSTPDCSSSSSCEPLRSRARLAASTLSSTAADVFGGTCEQFGVVRWAHSQPPAASPLPAQLFPLQFPLRFALLSVWRADLLTTGIAPDAQVRETEGERVSSLLIVVEGVLARVASAAKHAAPEARPQLQQRQESGSQAECAPSAIATSPGRGTREEEHLLSRLLRGGTGLVLFVAPALLFALAHLQRSVVSGGGSGGGGCLAVEGIGAGELLAQLKGLGDGLPGVGTAGASLLLALPFLLLPFVILVVSPLVLWHVRSLRKGAPSRVLFLFSRLKSLWGM